MTSPSAQKAPEGSGVAAQGAADIAQNKWSQEMQMAQPMANPSLPEEPRESYIPPIRTTQYGWPTDNASDRNTTVLKIGNHDNPLTPHSAALSDSEAAELGAKPGDVLRVGGQLYYYADRAPQSDKRVDLYQPQGMNKNIPDFQSIKNLGGGSSDWKGQQLSDLGEQNVNKLMQQSSVPVETQPPKAAAGTPVNQPGKITDTQISDLLGLIKGLNFRQHEFASLQKQTQ